MRKNVFLPRNSISKWFMSILFIGFALKNGHSQVICEGKKGMFYSSFNQCNNNEWVLVFEDEFNGNALDLSTWWLRPWGAGSLYGSEGETQEYNTLDNISVENGMIKIFALQDTVVRRAKSYLPDTVVLSDGLPNLREYHFTSSNIWSRKEFDFGRIEARIKIPKGKGLRPAFWMYGGNIRWNELDIFEFFNEKVLGSYAPSLLSKVITMTAHYDYDNDGETNKCIIKHTGEDYSEDFHIYALEWEPNKISWYVDGNCLREDFRYYNLLGQPADCDISAYTFYIMNLIYPINTMSIIFNLAIQNGEEGQPNDPAIFPANMYVDWIRYYRRGSNNNISVTDSTMYPLSAVTFNNIVGNTISFNCPYTINQGNQQCIVSATEVVLSSGFCVEEGGAFVATIDDNSNMRALDTTDEVIRCTKENVRPEKPIPDVSIYPTIGQGIFNIDISPNDSFSDLYVIVYDISGNKVLSQSLRGDYTYSINISNCPNGLYLIQVIDDHGIFLKTDKIIISR